MLSPQSLPALQRALKDAGLDGWLLYDFHGANPIAAGLIGLEGMLTRRIFVLVPPEGVPTAITHAIEQGPWRRWPERWGRERYSSWRALESKLAQLVRGKRVAMEYSPGDAVPYLDRVPAGVLEMVRAAGADVVSSAELVTKFYAVWSADHLASHRRAAERIAELAREAFAIAGRRAAERRPIHEHELQEWLLAEFARHGLEADHGPIVAASANAADPHYAPAPERPRPIQQGDTVLIDLWAREKASDGGEPGVFADQTWMASVGTPSARAMEVWTAVRDARDAAVALVRSRIERGQAVRGGEADDAARDVIRARGFADQFTHRTGHSIDPRDLHGAGPHLDNLETREERLLIPGAAFSVEPGVYLTGEIGMRSEINAIIGERELIVTPVDYQRDLIIV